MKIEFLDILKYFTIICFCLLIVLFLCHSSRTAIDQNITIHQLFYDTTIDIPDDVKMHGYRWDGDSLIIEFENE